MTQEIEQLKQRVKERQAELEQERQRHKKTPNQLMEEEAQDLPEMFDFWCDSCQEDFEAERHKTKYTLYGEPVAVWRAKCPNCDTEAIRHITHRDEDTYYYKSDKINRQRNQYAMETLQIYDYGFRTMYKEAYEKFHQGLQE